jgi:hypothetical protein
VSWFAHVYVSIGSASDSRRSQGRPIVPVSPSPAGRTQRFISNNSSEASGSMSNHGTSPRVGLKDEDIEMLLGDLSDLEGEVKPRFGKRIDFRDAASSSQSPSKRARRE